MTNPADAFYTFYFLGSLLAVGFGLILVFTKVKE